jgi:hypothetical protein
MIRCSCGATLTSIEAHCEICIPSLPPRARYVEDLKIKLANREEEKHAKLLNKFLGEEEARTADIVKNLRDEQTIAETLPRWPCDRLQATMHAAADRIESLEAEVERLRAALEAIAEGCDSGRHDGLPEEHPAHDADIMHYIACEALEGREWERLGNEKVGTHGSPEMNKTLEGMETERKRVVVDSQGFCDDTAPMRAALLWLADNFTLNAQTSTLIELPTKQPGSQLVHSGLLVAAALRQIARGGQG